MDMDRRSKTDKNNTKDNRRQLFYKSLLLLVFYMSYTFYLFWRFYYTIPKTYGYFSLIAGYLLFTAEFVGFIESAIFYLTLWNTSTPETPEVGNIEFPEVDILVASYNEANDILYKTMLGCKNIDYPDKSKVHIYLCDDGNREEVKKLCDKLEVGYITRTENTHAKAGNLNNALAKTSSPYVVTFDADMIPMHDFLIKTIPFFMTEDNIGFVQVPQNFYNPDLFQYNLFTENNLPNEQNLFSRYIQAGKSRFNAVIYAGSNTVLSRKALDEIGGLVVGTITEDFATGMKIQSKGYKSIYLNETHASGLSPESLEDLYNQRIRWARGVIQTFKTFNPLFMKGLNIFQKLMYFSAFSYWYFGIWRIIFLLAPIMFSVFGIVVLTAPAMQMLEIWLPMFVFTNIAFMVFTKQVRTVAWSHIYDTILFPQITMGVLKETFGMKMSKFKVTPKDNVIRKAFVNRFELVGTQIVIALLSLIGIIRILFLFITKQFEAQYIINLFWLVYNFYLLTMAAFFASERPKFRNSERVNACEDAYIFNGSKICTGKTTDISETGAAIILKNPIYLSEEENHHIRLKSLRNTCDFSAQIVRVDSFKECHKYVFKITEIHEEDFAELLLMLYDRVPAFPETQIGGTFRTNILKNINYRRKRIIPFNRKLPRIIIDKDVSILTAQGQDIIHVLDFNFMYLSVKQTNKYNEFHIPLGENYDITLSCVLEKIISRVEADNIALFKITNYKEFADIDLLSLLKMNIENSTTTVNIGIDEAAAALPLNQ